MYKNPFNKARVDFAKKSSQPNDRQPSKRIILLQGPVGPFFSRLQKHLNTNGFDAWRVVFNAGDQFFSNKDKRLGYSENPNQFEFWFRGILQNGEFDAVVLFGSERVLHASARRVADELGIAVVSLEEGYFRPGYLTIEKGANNRLSPIAGRLPPPDYEVQPRALAAPATNSFKRMVWWGFLYFVLRGLFTSLNGRKTFHKHRPLVSEGLLWLRNYWRWLRDQGRNYRLTEYLLEKKDKQYYLLPLQVADDTQLTLAGRGWDNDRFLESAICSFAKQAPKNTELVIKVHPLSRGHSNDRENAAALAKLYGAENRIHVLNSGSLGLLCRHAKGMLTINSTSGLSAIAHGTPLFIVGEAIYRHPALAWCADEVEELDGFWTDNRSIDKELGERYLSWLAHQAVVPGDFYSDYGINVALTEITEKIDITLQEHQDEAKVVVPFVRVAAV